MSPVERTAVPLSTVNPIRYSNLPAEERELVDPALADGATSSCLYDLGEEERSALKSFAQRVREHYHTGRETAYLIRDQDYYELYVRIEDRLFDRTRTA